MMDIWYHISRPQTLKSILKYGLHKGNSGNAPSQSGEGIYLFKGLENSDIVLEYLGFEEGIVISVDVTGHQLLMDEDALLVDDTHDLLHFYEIMPPEAVNIYSEYLSVNDGDTEAINDHEVAKFKVNLIDQFSIKANPRFTVEFGHYSLQTCRATNPKLKPIEVFGFDEYDEIYKIWPK